MLSPRTREAKASALKAARCCAPTTLPISATQASDGFSQPASLTKAAVGVLWPRLRLVVGYVRWFPTRRRTAARPELGADLSVHAATVRLGPLLRAGPLEFPLHLGVELGALRAVGVGGDTNLAPRGLWAAATAGAGLAWAPRALRGHGALVVTAEAAVALHRPTLVFNDDIEVYRIGPAAFRGQFALEVRFP